MTFNYSKWPPTMFGKLQVLQHTNSPITTSRIIMHIKLFYPWEEYLSFLMVKKLCWYLYSFKSYELLSSCKAGVKRYLMFYFSFLIFPYITTINMPLLFANNFFSLIFPRVDFFICIPYKLILLKNWVCIVCVDVLFFSTCGFEMIIKKKWKRHWNKG